MKAKNIGYYFYIAIVLGLCVVPLLLIGIRPGTSTTENRTQASWPVFYTPEKGINWSYLQEAGNYFTDHFAFRQELVTADARIRAGLFQVSPVEDVIVGENGWLYYAATLDDYQHKDTVSDRMLFNIAHNVALMQQYTESLGKTFVFTIAPNKNSLYPENMPRRFQYLIEPASDAERLRPWLMEENVRYADLYELFRQQEEVLYYARDSHWNQKGAVMVYHSLLDLCDKPHETYEQIPVEVTTDYYGDLSRMLYPIGTEPEEEIRYQKEFTWTYQEGQDVEDNFIRTVCDTGSQNLLMYRDSFGNSLLPYMAQSFANAAFSKQVPYPMTDLVNYSPDIVIVERVERHLPTLGRIPPLMNGPVCFPEGDRIRTDRPAASVELSKEGSYWKLEGLADQAYMTVNSPIYLEVNDGTAENCYEAFCVSKAENDTIDNDYGYILYLSEILLHGNTFQIKVMTEKDGNIIILQEEEIHRDI